MSVEITEIISINQAPHIPTRIVITGKEGNCSFEILSAYCRREHAVILATKLGLELKIRDYKPCEIVNYICSGKVPVPFYTSLTPHTFPDCKPAEQVNDEKIDTLIKNAQKKRICRPQRF